MKSAVRISRETARGDAPRSLVKQDGCRWFVGLDVAAEYPVRSASRNSKTIANGSPSRSPSKVKGMSLV